MRLTPLEYSYDPQTGVYFLMNGWRGQSDWFHNARAHPQVQIWRGKQRIEGRAEPASDEDVVKEIGKVLEFYPKAVKTWSRYIGNHNSHFQKGKRK